MHIQTHAHIRIIYIHVQKKKWICIFIYVCDSIWQTYSIHKMIINYSKHKLEHAKYVRPFGKHIPNLFFWDSARVEVAVVSESRIFRMKKILKPEQITPRWKKCFFLPLWHLIGPALSARGDPPWLGYQGGRGCPFFAVLERHLLWQESWFHPVAHF